MAGCYGNSREDRYFENMCDEYTKEDEMCSCDVAFSEDENVLIIGGYSTHKKEIEENDNFCLECGEKFNISKWF